MNFIMNLTEKESKQMHTKLNDLNISLNKSKISDTSSTRGNTGKSTTSHSSRLNKSAAEPAQDGLMKRTPTEPRPAAAQGAVGGKSAVVGAAPGPGKELEVKNTAQLRKVTPRNMELRGQNTNQSSILTAASRRAWLYVGRTSRDTTTEILMEYVSKKLDSDDVCVEELSADKQMQKYSRSFKIGINYDFLELVEDPNFWPKDIVVRRFRFFRAGKIPPYDGTKTERTNSAK